MAIIQITTFLSLFWAFLLPGDAVIDIKPLYAIAYSIIFNMATAHTPLPTPPWTVSYSDSDSDANSSYSNGNALAKSHFHTGGRIPLEPTSIDLEGGIPSTTPVRERQALIFANAARRIKPISHVWDVNTAVDIADNIGALLISAQVTPEQKRNADLMHMRLRRKAIRAGREDGDGVRVEGGDTESDETDGNGTGNFGSPTSSRGRKRKRSSSSTPPNGGPPPPGRGAVVTTTNPNTRDARPPCKRRTRSTNNQLLQNIDIALLQPQPIRLQYERPARGDRSDAWFIEAFRLLYREAETFAATYYCMHDLKVGTFYEPWNFEHTPEFIWWAEQVAEPDPVTGWDSLLRDSKERKWLVTGVIMRVLRHKIFDEELFGVNEQEAELMHAIEKTLFLSEGFHRTELRANTTRSLLGNSSVTGNFYPSVARLAAQISLMLQPLTIYLYSIPPPHGKRLPLVTDLYQSLHNLISRAAHLSLTIRLSPTIFHFVDVFPGSTYEPDDVYSLELESYIASKERIVTPYEIERVEWLQSKEEAKARVDALLAVGPVATNDAIVAQKRRFFAFYKNSSDGIQEDLEIAQEQLNVATEAVKLPKWTAEDIEIQRKHLHRAMTNTDPTLTELQKSNSVKDARKELHSYIRLSAEGLEQAQQKAQKKVDTLKRKVATTTPWELAESKRILDELVAKGAGATQKEIDEAQTEVARIDNAAPKPPGQYYRALTKIGVWPVITRYKPGGEDDDDAWEEDGPVRQSEKDGMRIMQMSKGATVNYYGRDDNAKPRKVSLRRWVRNKRRKSGKKNIGMGRTVVAAAMAGAAALGAWACGLNFEEVASTGLDNIFQFVGTVTA